MRSCPICQQPAARTVGELTNTKMAPLARTAYELGHCQTCDVVYLSPLPSEEDLRVIYVDELQFDYHTEEDRRAIVEFMVERLRTLMKRIGLDKPPSILEIGAGPAWMCQAAKAISPQAFTIAQDVSREVADKCPWADRYIVAPFESPEFDRLGPFDVISLTHVLEHLPDPVVALRRLRPMSKGLVFITAPHRPTAWDGSIEAWRTYSYNHVPAHLQYFSERGMARAAQAAGFTLAHWDATAEEGQALEAWLAPAR
jgi:SAM-dependent methyltransferase